MFQKPSLQPSRLALATLTTAMVLAPPPAWASRFASGYVLLIYIVALAVLAGTCGLAGVLAGRSRASLILGSCAAAWVAHWFVTDGAGGMLAQVHETYRIKLANIATFAAMPSFAAGWGLARWPEWRRTLVIATSLLTPCVLLLWFVEPALFLLALPVPAYLIPFAAGIALRQGIENVNRTDRLRRAAESTARGVRRTTDRVAACFAAAKASAPVRFVQRSRTRRAWLIAFAAYFIGFVAVGAMYWPLLAAVYWAAEPGRALHSMLRDEWQPMPDATIAWMVYGPVTAVLLGLASFALPIVRDRPTAVTSIEKE